MNFVARERQIVVKHLEVGSIVDSLEGDRLFQSIGWNPVLSNSLEPYFGRDYQQLNMEADDMVRLSVIVPIFNESAVFKPMLGELLHELSGRFDAAFEVIVVDDASTDGLEEMVKGFSGPITYVRHVTRLGSGTARRTGTTMAKGEICVWIDGDGTYRVSDLVDVVLNLGAHDQIIGVRAGDHGAWRFLRVTVKWVARSTAALLWCRRIPDLNSGLRAFQRKSMVEWLHLLPAGFSCTTTATLSALSAGQSVGYWPIIYQPRSDGSHSKFHPIRDTFRLYRTILKLRFSRWLGVGNFVKNPV